VKGFRQVVARDVQRCGDGVDADRLVGPVLGHEEHGAKGILGGAGDPH
jgi:hypothetical protein